MMTKAVIIDDEQNNVDNLHEILKTYCQDIRIVGIALDAASGKKIINDLQPDIDFLDIQMPKQNGFDMLKALNHYDFEIIFVTAYDQYAIQAMKFAAVDYILKPILIEELKSAVDRAIKRCQLKKHNQQLENLIELIQRRQFKEEHRIALPGIKETRFVKTNEIIHCESSNNYTTFYLLNNEKLVVSKPIYEYDDILTGYGFIRCHQSHLVNKQFIKSWLKEFGDALLLTDGAEIPVSRNKREFVKLAMESF
jgi:two-component system LytT family response regulator